MVAVGNNEFGQCNVRSWRDIISVSASPSHTTGLRADGTVVAVGSYGKLEQGDVNGWRDIISVSDSVSHTVGLKTDGTVLITGVKI